MSTGLKIKKDGALDFLSLGALVHRLDPGIIPFRKASRCDIHVSGGEFNVSANLSDCFRLNTGVASAMVVPEPGTISLLILSSMVVIGRRRRSVEFPRT